MVLDYLKWSTPIRDLKNLAKMTELTLKWEKFGLSEGLHTLLHAAELTDVTIACEGEFLQAHKTVLAACSHQFRKIFSMQTCQHPVVFMQDMKLTHIRALLNFMYCGEATVLQHELAGFMKAAESLKISGLTSSEEYIPYPSVSKQKYHFKAKDEDSSTVKKPSTSGQTWVAVKVNVDSEDITVVSTDDPATTEVSIHDTDDQNMETITGLDPEASEELPEGEYTIHTIDEAEQQEFFSKALLQETVSKDDEPQAGPSSSSKSKSKQGEKEAKYDVFGRNILVWGADGLKEEDSNRTCKKCNKKMKSRNSLRAHIYKYHSGRDKGKIHKCEICFKQYALVGGLAVHMKNIHGNLAQPVTCTDCGKEYPNKMAHYKHVYAQHRHRIAEMRREKKIKKLQETDTLK